MEVCSKRSKNYWQAMRIVSTRKEEFLLQSTVT